MYNFYNPFNRHHRYPMVKLQGIDGIEITLPDKSPYINPGIGAKILHVSHIAYSQQV